MSKAFQRPIWFIGLVLMLGVIGLGRRLPDAIRAEEQAGSPVRRVNVPYTAAADGSIPVPDRAIFWFGQVGPTNDNYADVRVIYNDDYLFVTLHLFDRLLFYKKNPSVSELVAWDAATLYLNLDGNAGSAPGVNAHRFVAQVNFNESRDGGAYQASYQGNGTDWSLAATPFVTTDGWQGQGLNDGAEDRGWNVTFKIPFNSLGLSSMPADGTVWGLGLAVHDRDDAGGAFIADKVWPETMSSTQPATWGQIHFGLPMYEPPPTNPGAVVTIRHGLDGVVVADGQVGGDSTCAQSLWPDFWPGWGGLNYSAGAAQERMNIQNQWNLGDWPCFSKYYVTFPLDGLPPDGVIISATLTVYQFGNSNQGGSYDPGRLPEPSLIQVMTVDDAWDEAALTWNTAPLAVENVGRAWVDPLPAGPPWPNVPRELDVSRAAAEAYEAGEPLRLALYSADNALHSGKYFRSSDASVAEARPTLELFWGYDKGFTVAVTSPLQRIAPGDTAVFTLDIQPTDGSVSSVDVAVGNPYADLSVSPASQTLSWLPGVATFSATDWHDPAFTSGLLYTLPITVTGGTAVQTTEVHLLLNGSQIHLPLIWRGD